MSNWRTTKDYKDMLTLMGSLSRLYSESDIPFIYYRATENLYCKYCNAKNLSREDTAYDARIDDLGIGIKTFQLKNGKSLEKIAEFNALSPQLRGLHGKELALKLADFRNERMMSANNLYGVNKAVYHIIGRTVGQLEVFDSAYDFVDKSSLKIIDETDKSLHFKDKRHTYSFNRSKSVLMKQFIVPRNKIVLPVSIIEDPFTLLHSLLTSERLSTPQPKKQEESVVLPLFGLRGAKGNKEKIVPEKSGLNQWNAAGRKRDYNEVYVPIPKKVHKLYPDFFPDRDTPFTLHLPNDKDTLSAKVCQDGSKALMTNPNKALGEWILRKVLRLEEGELLTYERLLASGFDSLKITKLDNKNYFLDVTVESYPVEEDDD